MHLKWEARGEEENGEENEEEKEEKKEEEKEFGQEEVKKQEVELARGVYAPEAGGKGREGGGGGEEGEPAPRDGSSVSSPTHDMIPSLKCACRKRTFATTKNRKSTKYII